MKSCLRSFSGLVCAGALLAPAASAQAEPPLVPLASEAPAVRAPPAMKTNSPGLIAGGIGLGAISVVPTVIGALALPAVGGGSDLRDIGRIGIAFFVPGVLGIAGGITMIVVGARKVPKEQALELAWARPRVSVGPTSASLTWAF